MLRVSRGVRYVFVIVLLVFASSTIEARSDTLDIDPAIQKTQVWCWLAVGEMVFKYYDIPTVNPAGIYQCGIVGGLAHGGAYHACSLNCSLCTMPAGSWQNVKWMLEEYPKRVSLYRGISTKRLSVDHTGTALDKSEVVDEIDDEQPIIAGISPSGKPAGANFTSQHVALIVGYEQNGNVLIVNDPYPFPADQWTNPYLAAGATRLFTGRYRISYSTFKNKLNWAESFTVRSVGNVSATTSTFPNYCCTPVGKLGPYPNNSVPVGGTCYGTTPMGPAMGQACP